MGIIFKSDIFKSSVGLAAGFIGAFAGVFLSRVYLTNHLDSNTLNMVFASSSLIALSVVLAVEGFSSSVPATFKEPLRYLKPLVLINLLLSVTIGTFVFVLVGMVSNEFRFMIEHLHLTLLSLIVASLISVGQLVEAVASMVGKNWIPIWRRSSIQFLALGLFAFLILLGAGVNDGITLVSLWLICLVLGGLVSVWYSFVLLFKEERIPEQVGFIETWLFSMRDYWGHHLGKLGLVLPRFIIPVLVLGLFGAEVNVSFVILWTVLGLVSVSVSAVSRGYMSNFSDSRAWTSAWQVWSVLILLPVILIGLLSPVVMGSFGAEYSTLSSLLIVGLIAMIPFSVLDLSSARLRSNGSVNIASVLTILSGIVLVVVVVVLGSLFNLTGIMWSYVIVYTLFAMVGLYMALKPKRITAV